MTTATGAVTSTDGVRHPVTCEVVFQQPLMIGWSSPLADMPGRLAQFPGTRYIRHFRDPGAGLPAWSSLDFLPKNIRLHVSVKDRGLPVGSWLSSRPASWTEPVVFTIDHEPEQQTSGDPTPAEFHDEWVELCNSLAGHPKRSQIILTPVFTRYYAELGSNAGTWYDAFGDAIEIPGVDAIGMDIYDPGSSAYQTSTEMFDWACDLAEAKGKDLYGAEWGRDREGADATGATAGTVCAQKMREDIAYLRTRRVRAVAWFYKGGDNLDTGGPNGGPRLPERQALADLIATQ